MGEGSGHKLVRQNTNLSMLGMATSVSGSKKRKIIPDSGLSRQLSEKKINILNDHDRKQYNLQKEKYKVAQAQKDKLPEKPEKKRWKFTDAERLEQGLYYDDDEQDDCLEAADLNQHVYLGRENIEDDLKLEEFELAIEAVKNTRDANMQSSLDKKLKGDCIPDEVRKELELP